jgi:hypothetical protein
MPAPPPLPSPAPPAPSATAAPPLPTPTAAPDTTKPVITQASVTPDKISELNPQLCSGGTKVVSVGANITDNVGVTEVSVKYTLEDLAKRSSAQMGLTSGTRFVATMIGPFQVSQTTTVQFEISARDKAGNFASVSAGSVQVTNC